LRLVSWIVRPALGFFFREIQLLISHMLFSRHQNASTGWPSCLAVSHRCSQLPFGELRLPCKSCF
jgi:hypothetical protein